VCIFLDPCIISLPAPELTIFLHISLEYAAQQRGDTAKLEMQARFRGVFGRVEEEIDTERWVTIDAGETQEGVGEDIWGKVSSG